MLYEIKEIYLKNEDDFVDKLCCFIVFSRLRCILFKSLFLCLVYSVVINFFRENGFKNSKWLKFLR